MRMVFVKPHPSDIFDSIARYSSRIVRRLMASLIHELENNEALLLMYLTGELPAEDCIEVEQMLAADGGMRAELVRIESAYQGAMDVLTKLDSDQSAVPAENHAIRQAMRAMKQWQVDRLARQPMVIAPARLKIHTWMYPVGVVAALLIGTIAWWGFGGQFPHFGHDSSGTDQNIAMQDDGSTDRQLAASLRRSEDSAGVIADAETQANTLVARSDASSETSSISFTEANP
jgi:anti-sigma factor RsiW